MVRIGWLCDTHMFADETKGMTSAALIEEYNWLLSNGCDWVMHTGDAVHSATSTANRMDDFDTFWNAISQTTDGGDALKYYIPGNHDIPLGTFLDSDPRATLRARRDEDGDDVSVLFLNTQANSQTYGLPAPNRQGGVASEVPRVPYRDLMWLDEQLADANTAKLVVPHASPYWLNGSSYGNVKSFANGNLQEKSFYNVVSNYERTHGILSSHSNVVVPVSHLYQFSGEGSETIDGVDYAWKNHSVAVDTQDYHTFGYIDIDATGASITTVDHSTKSTTAILSTTF